MGQIRWKLKNYLDERGIKALEVEKEAIRLGHTFGRNSIYRLLRDDGPDNLNRTTLAVLIDTLRALTRRKVKLSDIVDYIED